MEINPIRCVDQSEFNRIYNDLIRVGEKGREIIEIKKEGNGFIPVTAAKSKWYYRIVEYFYKPKSRRVANVAAFVEKFLEDNRRFLARSGEEGLYKLKIIFDKGKISGRFDYLVKYIEKKKNAVSESLRKYRERGDYTYLDRSLRSLKPSLPTVSKDDLFALFCQSPIF